MTDLRGGLIAEVRVRSVPVVFTTGSAAQLLFVLVPWAGVVVGVVLLPSSPSLDRAMREVLGRGLMV